MHIAIRFPIRLSRDGKERGLWKDGRTRQRLGTAPEAHEVVGSPQHGQPLLVILQLLPPLRLRKVHHLRAWVPTMAQLVSWLLQQCSSSGCNHEECVSLIQQRLRHLFESMSIPSP